MQQYRGEIITGPLKLELSFRLPRPKSHYRTGKHSDELRPDSPTFHTSKPDTTKLIRGVEDACTGLIWKDDAQIAIQHAVKVYADNRELGCFIRITPAL